MLFTADALSAQDDSAGRVASRDFLFDSAGSMHSANRPLYSTQSEPFAL